MFENENENAEYTPRTLHTRFGIIVTDKKHCRFVITRVNTVESPLVFLREWSDDTEYGYEEYYNLYRSALTADEADEILDLLQNNEKRKANALLKKCFKPEGVICESVSEIRLEDAVPDEWYDVWHEIKFFITCTKDFTGYYENDIKEQGF